jgi:(p)ppGpp synthase/HD superfamily hydrolase
LLHDVVEDTRRNSEDVRDGFGDEVAEMVAALTEDDAIDHYLPRKRVLRGAIVAAGSPVVDVALADKIATLRHSLITGTRVTERKLAHYGATWRLAVAADAAPHLSRQLGELLARFA